MSQDDQLCRCDEAAPRETDDGLKNDVCLGLFFINIYIQSFYEVNIGRKEVRGTGVVYGG